MAPTRADDDDRERRLRKSEADCQQLRSDLDHLLADAREYRIENERWKDRIEKLVDGHEDELRAQLGTIRELVQRITDELRATETDRKLVEQALQSGLASVGARVESLRLDQSAMAQKIDKKTDPGQVGSILDHKILLLVGALWVAFGPKLPDLLVALLGPHH